MYSLADFMLIFGHAWQDLSGIWMQLIILPGGGVPSTWLLGVHFLCSLDGDLLQILKVIALVLTNMPWITLFAKTRLRLSYCGLQCSAISTSRRLSQSSPSIQHCLKVVNRFFHGPPSKGPPGLGKQRRLDQVFLTSGKQEESSRASLP